MMQAVDMETVAQANSSYLLSNISRKIVNIGLYIEQIPQLQRIPLIERLQVLECLGINPPLKKLNGLLCLMSTRSLPSHNTAQLNASVGISMNVYTIAITPVYIHNMSSVKNCGCTNFHFKRKLLQVKFWYIQGFNAKIKYWKCDFDSIHTAIFTIPLNGQDNSQSEIQFIIIINK